MNAAQPQELVLSQLAAADRDLAQVLHETRNAETKMDVAPPGPYEGRRIVRVTLRAAALESA